jgi:hypothetical protein
MLWNLGWKIFSSWLKDFEIRSLWLKRLDFTENIETIMSVIWSLRLKSFEFWLYRFLSISFQKDFDSTINDEYTGSKTYLSDNNLFFQFYSLEWLSKCFLNRPSPFGKWIEMIWKYRKSDDMQEKIFFNDYELFLIN